MKGLAADKTWLQGATSQGVCGMKVSARVERGLALWSESGAPGSQEGSAYLVAGKRPRLGGGGDPRPQPRGGSPGRESAPGPGGRQVGVTVR